MANIEELVLKAMDTDSEEVLNEILDVLKEDGDLSKGEASEHVLLLLEAWGETIYKSDPKTNFCLEVIRMSPPDTPVVRNAFAQAMKQTLPKKYSRRGALASTGIREASLSLAKILRRFDNLRILSEDAIFYQCDSHQWYAIADIDLFTNMLTMTPVKGKGDTDVELDTILGNSIFFSGEDDVKKVYNPGKKTIPSSEKWRGIVAERAAFPVEGEELYKMAQYTLVPDFMTQEVFETWWLGEEASQDDATKNRRLGEARSLEELRLILTRDETLEIVEDDCHKLTAFFERMKPDLSGEDQKKLFESLSIIGEKFTDEQIKQALTPVKGKFAFFPEEIDGFINLYDVDPWGEIASRHLPGVAHCVNVLFGDEYLPKLLVWLPQRCLNAMSEHMDQEYLREFIEKHGMSTPDLGLYIWKNRKKIDADIVDTLHMHEVVKLINSTNFPPAWQSARRELKKITLDNKEFQKAMLEREKDDVAGVVRALEGATEFSSSEQQSLLVKLSRHSEILRKVLEKGDGRKLVEKSQQAGEKEMESSQATRTSVRSFNLRMKQLKDIINRQIPENTAAIAHARSYGDLRENAEYKAAKEEEGRLLRRRSELERDVLNAQPLQFSTVEVGDSTTVGSTIEVELGAGKINTYYLVGAWDADPDKHYVSYTTKLGECLIHRQVGDQVDLPMMGSGKIVRISPLPESVVTWLDTEE